MLLIAKVNFVSSHRNVLGFFSNEIFLILDDDVGSPDWFLVINSSGDIGYIPDNPKLLTEKAAASKKKELRFIDTIIDKVNDSAKAIKHFTEYYIILLRLLFKVRFLICKFGPNWRHKTKFRNPRSSTSLTLTNGSLSDRVSKIDLNSVKDIQEDDSQNSNENPELGELLGPPKMQLQILLGFLGCQYLDCQEENIVGHCFQRLQQHVDEIDVTTLRDSIKDLKEKLAYSIACYYEKECREKLRLLILKVIGSICRKTEEITGYFLNTALPLVLIKELQEKKEDFESKKTKVNALSRLFSTSVPLRLELKAALKKDFLAFLLTSIESSSGQNDLCVAYTELVLRLSSMSQIGYAMDSVFNQVSKSNSLVTNLCLHLKGESEQITASKLLLQLLSSPQSSSYLTPRQISDSISIMMDVFEDMAKKKQWWPACISIIQELLNHPKLPVDDVLLTNLQTVLLSLRADRYLREDCKALVDDTLKLIPEGYHRSCTALRGKGCAGSIVSESQANEKPKNETVGFFKSGSSCSWKALSTTNNLVDETNSESSTMHEMLTPPPRIHPPKGRRQISKKPPTCLESKPSEIKENRGLKISFVNRVMKLKPFVEDYSLMQKQRGLLSNLLTDVMNVVKRAMLPRQYIRMEICEEREVVSILTFIYSKCCDNSILLQTVQLLLEVCDIYTPFGEKLLSTGFPSALVKDIKKLVRCGQVEEVDLYLNFAVLLTRTLSFNRELPRQVSDLLNVDFINILLDLMDSGSKGKENIANSALVIILAINLHFEGPSVVINTIAKRNKYRNLLNSLLMYLKRGFDPVFFRDSTSQNSILKIYSDLFTNENTRYFFREDDVLEVTDTLTHSILLHLSVTDSDLPRPEMELLHLVLLKTYNSNNFQGLQVSSIDQLSNILHTLPSSNNDIALRESFKNWIASVRFQIMPNCSSSSCGKEETHKNCDTKEDYNSLMVLKKSRSRSFTSLCPDSSNGFSVAEIKVQSANSGLYSDGNRIGLRETKKPSCRYKSNLTATHNSSSSRHPPKEDLEKYEGRRSSLYVDIGDKNNICQPKSNAFKDDSSRLFPTAKVFDDSGKDSWKYNEQIVANVFTIKSSPSTFNPNQSGCSKSALLKLDKQSTTELESGAYDQDKLNSLPTIKEAEEKQSSGNQWKSDRGHSKSSSCRKRYHKKKTLAKPNSEKLLNWIDKKVISSKYSREDACLQDGYVDEIQKAVQKRRIDEIKCDDQKEIKQHNSPTNNSS